MKILGIETSSYSGSLAIADDERILGELSLNLGPKHSEKLIPAFDFLLKETGLERREIEGVAVSVGPGSFTALRVGIATAKGIAFSLKIPVAGVSSLEILAGNLLFTPFTVCPLIDAKKKELFAAFFTASDGFLTRVSYDMLISPEKLCDMVHEKVVFLGDAACLYGDLLRSRLGELALFCPPGFNALRASNCIFPAARRLKDGSRDDLSALAPLYLRKAEAETFKQGVMR